MSIEAMKQALEVLENFVDDPRAQHQIDAASAVLRQAIADVEKQEPVGEMVAWPNDFERVGVDWISYVPEVGTKLYTHPQPQEELSKLTVADDINQLCLTGELPIQFEDLADWVADGKWPVNTDGPTKQLVETLLRALENEQDRNRLEDVCVDATDAAVLLGRQYLGLVNKQINSDLKKSECWCHSCNRDVLVNGIPFSLSRMILCPDCGNKRCPKANNHTFACTNSNEPNQVGSAYNFGPK